MEQVLDTGGVGRSRRDADEPRLISEEQAEALIAHAREQVLSCSVSRVCCGR